MQSTTTHVVIKWSRETGRYIVLSEHVNMAFMTREDARRSFRPGTPLVFVGGPA